MKSKIVSIIMVFVTILAFSGCEDDLLEKSNPNEPSTGSFYKTPEEAELAINSAYSALQMFGVYNRYWIYNSSARSDESIFTEKQVGLPEVNGLDDFSMTSTVPTVMEAWRDNYNGIFKANMVLENVSGVDFPDVSQKNRILGEAHFLRALYHLNLILNFSEEIPVYASVPRGGEDFFPASAAPGVAYALIESDFKAAKELLPNVEVYRGTKNLGKVSKAAATAYLGKVYLFQKKYQDAANEFGEIIAGQCGHYELVSQFRENSDNLNENNLESIFEVQYMLTSGGVWNISGENQDASEGQIIEQECTNLDGISGLWWNQEPGPAMIAEFEQSDARYYKTFWCPNGDTYDIDGTAYTYEEFAGPRAGHFGWRKWGSDYATASVECDVNVRLMRLADVYLMMAECLIEGATGTGTPAQYINMVRDRARNIPDAGNYPLVGSLPTVEELIAASPTINGRTINSMEAALRHERMVELAFEGKRWDDIVRWGIGEEIFGSTFKEWLPIYQGDLDTNPNLKPNASN